MSVPLSIKVTHSNRDVGMERTHVYGLGLGQRGSSRYLYIVRDIVGRHAPPPAYRGIIAWVRIEPSQAPEISRLRPIYAALGQIVELCMKANDLETARILIKGIQTGIIRERLLEEYPISFY
jgi:hypothetical protein